MHTGAYRVYLHRPDFSRIGRVIFRRLRMVLRHNAGGTWELDADAREPIYGELEWGSRIVVERAGAASGAAPVFSGPFLVRRRRRRDNTLQLLGVDETALLGSRLAYPVLDGPPFAAASHDEFSGPTESALHHYVARNAADLAYPTRTIGGLVRGPDLGQGEHIAARARLPNLLTFLGELAAQGGGQAGIGFRVVFAGAAGLRFETFVPADRSAEVRFSEGRRNLLDWEYEERAPGATVAIVGGQGEQELRDFLAYEETAIQIAHGGARWEIFVHATDVPQGNDATLLQRARAALAESGARTSLSITPRDTATVAYGAQYRVGEIVAVELGGETITDVVREVHLTIDRDGVTVEPVIGTPNAEHPRVPGLFAALARAGRATNKLETGR